MAEWRIGRGWDTGELRERLDGLERAGLNFRASQDEMTVERGWNRYSSEAVIGQEPPGPPLPHGPFQRAEVAVANYQFSDPTIVVGHFDAESRLLGRRMLLEMTALRVFRYLGGVVVGVGLALLSRVFVSVSARSKARTAERRLRSAIEDVTERLVVEPIEAVDGHSDHPHQLLALLLQIGGKERAQARIHFEEALLMEQVLKGFGHAIPPLRVLLGGN